jgi:hypothetical protein
MRTRAKFRCTDEVQRTYNRQADPIRSYEFHAMYDESIPDDQRYAKTTPLGTLTITVDNPAIVFEPGTSYYLDITPADEG